ncbi:MAG: gamma-glutamyl-gamma-aminobutyrate hydrolase family protein [Thermodesulfovibrionales bacterium]
MRPVIGITVDIHENFLRLRQEYVSAVVHAGGVPLLLPPVGGDIPFSADAVDGLLLTGGGDIPPEEYGESVAVPCERLTPVRRERVAYEKALLEEVVRRGKPVLGICFGMQLINVAFGGTLYQDISLQVPHALDHRVSPHRISLSPVPGGLDHAVPGGASAAAVNSFHHQAVKEVGRGLEVFARAEDGIVEGFFSKDFPFLVGVQWHPERGVEGGGSPDGFWLAPPNCGTLSLAIFELFMREAGTGRAGGGCRPRFPAADGRRPLPVPSEP